MDYAEEQKSEIEALESIYYGDVEIISTEPHHKFSIPIKSEEYEPETENGLACTLTFTYTSKYPEEPPLIEIENSDNIDGDDERRLSEHILEQAKENLGMVMIFTLVSAGQEWLNVQWETIRKRREDDLVKKQQEEEEAERKRFEGTRVTVETFLRWKASFEDDMGITKKKEAVEKEGKKLTGREQFVTDKTLIESDLKYLEDTTSRFDESLFEEMYDDMSDNSNEFDPSLYSDESY